MRCHSLDESRKDPLIQDFTDKVKQKILVTNVISSDNQTIELLDRCKTLERVKEDPLVRELIEKLKNKVYANAGKTVYWDEVLNENPTVPTLLGYALLNELNVPRNYDLRREILDNHRDVPILLFYSLLNEITNIPNCDVLSGEFERRKNGRIRELGKIFFG